MSDVGGYSARYFVLNMRKLEGPQSEAQPALLHLIVSWYIRRSGTLYKNTGRGNSRAAQTTRVTSETSYPVIATLPLWKTVGDVLVPEYIW